MCRFRDLSSTSMGLTLLPLLLTLISCGENPRAPTEPAAPSALTLGVAAGALTFAQIDAGTAHTCAITPAGKAWCWGDGTAGGLGTGAFVFSPKPVAVTGGLQFLEIRAGTGFSCGLDSDHRAWCWGANQYGQLGDGTTTLRNRPVLVSGGRLFRQIHPGLNHTCALTFQDAAYCWGQNDTGQLGDSTTTNHKTPTRVRGGIHFKQVRAGGGQSCGLDTDNHAWCWGLNNVGQLGDGSSTRRLIPVRVLGGHEFNRLSVGGASACAVTPGNAAWCWGLNDVGQLADGTDKPARFRPVLIAENHRYIGVAEGDDHGCGILVGGATFCWGRAFFGAVGNGLPLESSIEERVPVPVVNGDAFDPINSGAMHTCGIDPAGHAWCWGWNAFGQLGDGTTQDRSVPVAVVGPN